MTTVELTESNLFDFLLNEPRARKDTAATIVKTQLAQPVQKSRRRCRCGHCPRCVDNARWERIFEAKFADPNYYSPRPMRHESSINAW
jgi:hypothetical protein